MHVILIRFSILLFCLVRKIFVDEFSFCSFCICAINKTKKKLFDNEKLNNERTKLKQTMDLNCFIIIIVMTIMIALGILYIQWDQRKKTSSSSLLCCVVTLVFFIINTIVICVIVFKSIKLVQKKKKKKILVRPRQIFFFFLCISYWWWWRLLQTRMKTLQNFYYEHKCHHCRQFGLKQTNKQTNKHTNPIDKVYFSMHQQNANASSVVFFLKKKNIMSSINWIIMIRLVDFFSHSLTRSFGRLWQWRWYNSKCVTRGKKTRLRLVDNRWTLKKRDRDRLVIF